MTQTQTNTVQTIKMSGSKPFRILQLTDVHIGGGLFSVKKDKMALHAVETLVKAAKADLVVVTGDIAYPIPIFSGTNNNMRASKRFGALMTSLGAKWTFVFGNHDAESFSTHSKAQLADYYTSLPNCLFERGEHFAKDLGNYCIRLENADGTLNNLLMFLDSNAYLTNSFFSGFDVIHDEQIDWYERTVKAQSDGTRLAPSLAFFHIPPKEFRDAWEHAYRGDGKAQYHLGFVEEKDNYFGYPKTVDGKFFSRMVALGSCKGMFVGHDHLNTLSLTYQGIRLTYGMSIDYLAYQGITKKHTQRGGTIIEIAPDSTFNVRLLPLGDLEKTSYFTTKM